MASWPAAVTQDVLEVLVAGSGASGGNAFVTQDVLEALVPYPGVGTAPAAAAVSQDVLEVLVAGSGASGGNAFVTQDVLEVLLYGDYATPPSSAVTTGWAFVG